MIIDRINDAYFDWMYRLICGKRYPRDISYRRLLATLHNIDFVYSIPKDGNRAADGIDLRYRFDHDLADILEGQPCSVLEMMLALAIRCEETIMDDTRIGDRTSQWFWNMITNLGLGSMTDNRYDRDYIEECVRRFLDREYEPDGEGGLFRIRNCDYDLRDVEIWYQMCWYLDTIN